jgi:GTPase SAR1 family protein
VSKGGVSIENWIGLWLKHFNKDPKVAFRDMIYVGYCGKMKDAIVPIHARPRDINGVPSFRKSFNALVIGAQNCGKTSFLRSFVEQPFKEQDITIESCTKAIREKDPKKKDSYTVKYLTLWEIQEAEIQSASLKRADVILLLFEANDAE